MKLENKITHEIYDRSPYFLKNIFASLVGLKNKRNRYSKTFRNHCDLLNAKMNFSLTELKSYQLSKFKELVDYVYHNIEYYNNLFNQLNLTPKDFNNLEDIKKIPYLTKEKVRSNQEIINNTNLNDKLISTHTSGTTGSSLIFNITKEAMQKEYAFVWTRGRKNNYSEKNLTFNGRSIIPINQIKPPFWIYNFPLKQILFSQYHMNDKNLKYYIKKINKSDFSYIEGYPSTLYIISDYINKNDINLDSYPEFIYTSSETLYEWQRDSIEKAFNSRIFDLYGTAEKTIMITECEYGNYHVNYEYGITEFEIIEETDKYKKCELIGTGFLNKAFPLLRYKTGDYVLINKNKNECECKMKGPIIERIEGRMEDIIITPDNRKIGRLDHIFKDMINIKESQIIQEEKDKLIVKIVKRNDYTLEDENLLYNELTNRLGNEFTYKFKYVDKIQRTSSGKFKAVISKI